MYTKKDFWIDNIHFMFGVYNWSFYGPIRGHLSEKVFNENLDYFTDHINGIYSSDDCSPDDKWSRDIISILFHLEGLEGITPTLIDQEFFTDLKARYNVISCVNKANNWFIMNRLNCGKQFIDSYDFMRHL